MFEPDRSAKALELWLEKRGELEEILGYEFQEVEWLQQAVTHRSFAHEARDLALSHYERLEFLGDAVLELIISHTLWERYPSLSEGDLTRLRAELVKKRTLARVARRLELGPMLLLGKGEEKRGGQDRTSILADAMEALLGAVFLDGGISAARITCLRVFREEIRGLDLDDLPNFKNRLQELAASLSLSPPSYHLLETEGPEHGPTFVMEVSIPPEFRATGRGKSKKTATQEAAKQLLLAIEAQESAEP